MAEAEDRTTQPRRVLDVLEALSGYAVTGAANSDIGQAVGISPSNTTRALAVLVAKGWARKCDETGRYYPTAAFTRLSFRVLADFQRAETKLQDQRRNMTGA